MRQLTIATSIALVLPALMLAGGCTTTTEKSQSLQRIDDLLAQVERVQVESLVGKEKARAAIDQLDTLVAPEFAGDPAQVYAQLLTAIEQSETQDRTFASAISPLSSTAEQMFMQWTSDLEAFGNSRMRERSHMRLEETRTRYQTVLNASNAAHVSYEAFNADLRDHALFLGHDFNSTALSSLKADVLALKERSNELDARFDACANAAKAYVEAAALHGQMQVTGTETTTSTTPTNNATSTPANEPAATNPNPANPRKRRWTTVGTKPAPAPAPQDAPQTPPSGETAPNPQGGTNGGGR